MTDQPTTGGCLCGAIRYSLPASASPIYSVICHCTNCKKSSGTHMVNTSIFTKDVCQTFLSFFFFFFFFFSLDAQTQYTLLIRPHNPQQFTLTHGTPKTYRDADTDSGTPVFRHFCGDCGSPVYITTPLLDEIRAVFSGTLDDATVRWRPNKGERASFFLLPSPFLPFPSPRFSGRDKAMCVFC
ncbi:hypothetical protein BK809_0003986 [Diplodia seriata]|uniref:CENP-V/GFA domain-containing protein n=1 Tax=Diplodia seriata TaxID=420778 RepID=A0A1S8BD18_9PEZI|nr:hypothetical protein BK809_0003986 [Diplodia seriata]